MYMHELSLKARPAGRSSPKFKSPNIFPLTDSPNVIGYGKRAHFAQELIFHNKQLKNVPPLDFVHNSDSLKCYNFSQEDQFFML